MPDSTPAPEAEAEPEQVPSPPDSETPAEKKMPLRTRILVIIGLALAFAALVSPFVFNRSVSAPAESKKATNSATSQKTTSQTSTSNLPGLQLDTAKDYGNKYKDGILPVGDNKYTTDAPTAGYIYACAPYAHNLTTAQGGAGSRGPWFTNNGTEYDINKKAHVQGSVMWQAEFTNSLSGATRTIVTNDLPTHPTGIFPIASTDPASAYDRNPNSIKGQSLTYALNANPTYGDPNCIGGSVGIMLTGVALFNGFDAAGRDAGAWEVQDSCSGHPQNEGLYHYHTLSSCIKGTSVHTVIGYALDGFPITGPNVGANNILTTSDLDECHGITSQITLGSKSITTYHYVMTEDFPYSVSCFRSAAIQQPGMH